MSYKKEFYSTQKRIEEIGKRLQQIRLNGNITQAELAHDVGISQRTIIRLEEGNSVQLSTLIKIMTALGLTENLENLIPEVPVSPLQIASLKGQERQRASSRKENQTETEWSWEDDT